MVPPVGVASGSSRGPLTVVEVGLEPVRLEEGEPRLEVWEERRRRVVVVAVLPSG